MMKKLTIYVFILLAFSLLNATIIHIPADYPAIQEGINASVDGDTVLVADVMGREVTQLVNTTQEAGYRSVKWNATNSFGKPVSAGVYLYQIRAEEFVKTKKMVLLK
jgi:flagellar hook assembly protein FlgD